MSYQVLARKWRPQRFDEVIGQPAVTRTLTNAISSGRIAQAFLFSGPRGCGKTTTARILARALNCVQGPTAEPCGECDACTEIAQSRDIDVLEIDAASHTGIDNIREVVIAGLAIAPARDRFKIFIIDEVHQLSIPSFNALLKSIEEPPPHVVFMMATTALHKIPDTILSRLQVFELRAISTKKISDHLRTIAGAEKIEVPDSALALIARAAEGSMRDAQSAFDQVMAFAGNSITLDDVSTVLGLVGRDLLFDIISAVIAEDMPKAFKLADQAVEAGHELKLVCRELASVVRDMMIISVDSSRMNDTEISETERERLELLAKSFSREDLMRSFDVLAKAEQEIRVAAQPRYHFEMALLRWMHVRKLVPLTNLLLKMDGDSSGSLPPLRNQMPSKADSSQEVKANERAIPITKRASKEVVKKNSSSKSSMVKQPLDSATALKDALLAEIQTAKGFFYNTVVAQAHKIDVSSKGVTFSFLPTHRALREQFEQTQSWLEQTVEKLSGKKLSVVATQVETMDASSDNIHASTVGQEVQQNLETKAKASSTVQAVLDVFPAKIRDVEEM